MGEEGTREQDGPGHGARDRGTPDLEGLHRGNAPDAKGVVEEMKENKGEEDQTGPDAELLCDTAAPQGRGRRLSRVEGGHRGLLRGSLRPSKSGGDRDASVRGRVTEI